VVLAMISRLRFTRAHLTTVERCVRHLIAAVVAPVLTPVPTPVLVHHFGL